MKKRDKSFSILGNFEKPKIIGKDQPLSYLDDTKPLGIFGDKNPTEVILKSFGDNLRISNHYKEITKPFNDLYKRNLIATVKEQEKVYEESISKGYAYSTYYHVIMRIIKRHEDSDDIVHVLIESELFSFILTKLSKVEDSKYVAEVFKNINRKNLTHHIPFLTLLIERLMRILTENLEERISMYKLKETIEDSLSEYEVVHKRAKNTSEEEEKEIEIMERQIGDNAKTLYEKTFNEIIQKDFMQNEDKVKGSILNRHALLHGKQDFDDMEEEDAIKLVFLILFFLDLINLKDKGELVIKELD
jgi:hypothetical protein